MSTFDQPYRPSPLTRLSDQGRRVRRIENAAPDGKIAAKLVKDTVAWSDPEWTFEIEEDLHNQHLIRARCYVVTAGVGATTIMVRNVTQAVDMLTVPITIDSGELRSIDAAVQPVVDTDNDLVQDGDLIAVVAVAMAAGALGFGFSLRFGV